MKFISSYISILLIAVSSYTSAQTFCSGDSVTIVVTGYTGPVQWQQSTDLTDWFSVPGMSGTNDSLSFYVTQSLYYRAAGTDGVCPFYSDTTIIVVNPVAPVAIDALYITPTSFDASWEASATPGITRYYLDVASDAGFTTFIPGYNNLQVDDPNGYISYTVSGLTCNTPYYYRVRAYSDSCARMSINSNPIAVFSDACPSYCTVNSTCSGDLTDSRDNQVYKTIQIGNQCWMAENLNVGTYTQGAVPQTSQNTAIEKYCYGDNTANCDIYGGLYMWDEMMNYSASVNTNGPGPQGICPAGWHLPTQNEWKCLEMNLGMTQTAADDDSGYRGTTEGGKLKQTGTTLWNAPNTGGTNSSGFTALPGGYRSSASGSFGLVKISGYWWAATEADAASGWYRYLTSGAASVYLGKHQKATFGESVRCVKN